MYIIDAHQHFWKYHVDTHGWINDEMAVIRKDFMPSDVAILHASHQVSGCIAVQAEQSLDETNFLLSLAAEYHFIKGVVGWIDLLAPNIEAQLASLKQHQILKGFRHILQAEQPEFMLQPAFHNGINALTVNGYTYDVLVYPHHLKAVIALVRAHPNQKFVLDHIAKPFIKTKDIASWASDIRTLAACDNIYCKVSGLITEADYRHWQLSDFTPYLNVITEAFGTHRIMFGSDWPVCLVAANYTQVLSLVQDYYAAFSAHEQAAIMGGNAARFYSLT
jgi:L-fuconolactonase